MKKAKRVKKEKNYTILKILLIVLFIYCVYTIILKIVQDNTIKPKENYNISEKIVQDNLQNNIKDTITSEVENVTDSNTEEKNIIQSEYKGYKVSSLLEIPKIDLVTTVLDEYSKKGLDTCVSKYWGEEPNEIGNFCIAGHNFKNKNMFYNLYKLEIKDVFYLTDNKNGKFKYEIYDIYKVKPQETQCLSQETNGNVEVTLITCTNDSKYRIIVKARKV